MRYLAILMLVAGLATASFADSHGKADMSKKKMAKKELAMEKAYYTCSMHPDVHAAKPGKCPVCKMDLVMHKPEAKKAMHKKGMKKMAATDLKCTCGTKVKKGQKKTPCPACTAKKMAKDGKDVYYCPHHQGVMQDKPGKCSKCSMDLMKWEPEKSAKKAKMKADKKAKKMKKEM